MNFSQLNQILKNMGLKYCLFRFNYELKRKIGLLKRKYPVSYSLYNFISLSEWRKSDRLFFFQSKETIVLPKRKTEKLQQEFSKIDNGEFCYFSSQWYNLGKDDDWVTNPDTGYKYDNTIHWTEIEDIDKVAGDIKYVWERSRFSFLYTIIRHDYHFNEDHSVMVFGMISDWIDKNRLNCGPNYKCSQEISLRVLSWVFALNYYKFSETLTEAVFQKIINSIYWQMCHVYNNIHFSRIAVRNNHAITETLALYVVGLLFPFFPFSLKWKIKGKRWFEKEILYQIMEDGTYLQFSMNYHRVVVQLLTIAFVLAYKNGEKFNRLVYQRAYRSVNFLFQCQEESTGFLPNYGSNDGALFFTLNDNDYRDYRPQLDAFHYILTGESLYKENYEDLGWYSVGNKISLMLFSPLKKQYGLIAFQNGGYYLIREHSTFTFIRCGKHKDRPSHADNLHLDIWYNGENVLLDGGSYKYNTEDSLIKYFSGTESHNTVMLDHYDQMLKGDRFIWYHWSQAVQAVIYEQDSYYCFIGTVRCFTYLNQALKHIRKITKIKGVNRWIVEDIIKNKPSNVKMRQMWHTKSSNIQLNSEKIIPVFSNGLYSVYYGKKEETQQIEFITDDNAISTTIQIV
jgi:hypothetical protein